MKVWSNSFADGAWIPSKYALGKPDGSGKTEFSDNLNPHLAWSHLPEGTKSVAVVMYDLDVPSVPDDVHQEGRVVPADLPRAEFSHWVWVGLSPDAVVEEGAVSQGVKPGGKAASDAPAGTRYGINDYTGWFAEDADMAGDYFGYDGPCPPWNDGLVHRYQFTVYALDTDTLALTGRFTRTELMKAIEGHVLDQASLQGKYKIYAEAVER
jgi:Raf kinase inhibitor-like YbhB/YbcL family protein